MILQGNLKVLFNRTMVFLFKKSFKRKLQSVSLVTLLIIVAMKASLPPKSRLASFLKTCLFSNGPTAFLLKASR